jgi:dihydrofolate reductase
VTSNITIIAATEIHNGIGIGNSLPWYLPEDLAHFKRTTSGKIIVMGRKTFESIGHPLIHRRNIVVTRDPMWYRRDVEITSSLSKAIAKASGSEIFVIGGAEIYAAAIHLAQRLIITEIQKNFRCDSFFPVYDSRQWKEVSRENHYSKVNGFKYSFVIYQRHFLIS